MFVEGRKSDKISHEIFLFFSLIISLHLSQLRKCSLKKQVMHLTRGYSILQFCIYFRLQINYVDLVCSNNIVLAQLAEYCKMESKSRKIFIKIGHQNEVSLLCGRVFTKSFEAL